MDEFQEKKLRRGREGNVAPIQKKILQIFLYIEAIFDRGNVSKKRANSQKNPQGQIPKPGRGRGQFEVFLEIHPYWRAETWFIVPTTNSTFRFIIRFEF